MGKGHTGKQMSADLPENRILQEFWVFFMFGYGHARSNVNEKGWCAWRKTRDRIGLGGWHVCWQCATG